MKWTGEIKKIKDFNWPIMAYECLYIYCKGINDLTNDKGGCTYKVFEVML